MTDVEPAVMTLTSRKGMQNFGVEGLDTTVRTSLDHQRVRFASTDEAEMAVTVARTDVAMKKWLSIVGAAKRGGRTAISHQHGTFMDSIQHGCSAFSCGGSKPVNRISRLASSSIIFQRFSTATLPDEASQQRRSGYLWIDQM